MKLAEFQVGYIIFKIKKKNLTKMFEYGNPTNQLRTQSKK